MFHHFRHSYQSAFTPGKAPYSDRKLLRSNKLDECFRAKARFYRHGDKEGKIKEKSDQTSILNHGYCDSYFYTQCGSLSTLCTFKSELDYNI